MSQPTLGPLKIFYPPGEWFKAPSAQTAMVHAVLIISATGALLYPFAALLLGTFNTVVAITIALQLATYIVLLVLNQRGHTQLVAWLVSFAYIIAAALLLPVGEAAVFQIGTLYVIAALLGTYTLGIRGGVVVGVIAAATSLASVVYTVEVANADYWQASSPYMYWFAHVLYIVFTVFTLAVARTALARNLQQLNTMRQSLADTHERLNITQSRFDTLTQRLPVGVFITDPQGNTQYGNPVFWQLLGAGTGQLNGVWELLPESEHLRIRELARQILRKHQPINFEAHFSPPDGSTRWVAVNAIPQFNEDGSLSHVLGIVQDITAQKLAEKARIDGQRNQLLHALIHEFAHDLRDPLSALMMSVQTLSLAATPPPALTAEIEQKALGVEAALHSLLVLSHAEQDEYPLKLTEVNLVALAHDALAPYRRQLDARGLQLAETLPATPVLVTLGEREMRRALRHLVARWVQTTPQNGQMRLTIELSDDAPPKQMVRLELWNSHTGNSILNDFPATDNAATATGPGNALGISLARAIMKLHCGDLKECQDKTNGGVGISCQFPVDLRHFQREKATVAG